VAPAGGGRFGEGFSCGFGLGFGLGGDAGDERGGEAEFGAELGFAVGHFAVVDLVVEAGEVKQAVEEEDADLVAEGVAEGLGLAGGGVERDGEIAGMVGGDLERSGEAEDVGGFVFAAEGAVETTEFGVGGEENFDLAGEADSGAGAVEEAREAGFREGWFDGVAFCSARFRRLGVRRPSV
jgi:hypothetical protein